MSHLLFMKISTPYITVYPINAPNTSFDYSLEATLKKLTTFMQTEETLVRLSVELDDLQERRRQVSILALCL